MNETRQISKKTFENDKITRVCHRPFLGVPNTGTTHGGKGGPLGGGGIGGNFAGLTGGDGSTGEGLLCCYECYRVHRCRCGVRERERERERGREGERESACEEKTSLKAWWILTPMDMVQRHGCLAAGQLHWQQSQGRRMGQR